MNLYVIGNGFDIDHHIASAYTNFKESLADSDDDNAKLLLEIIETAHQENQENLWKDLEESIGRLDLDYVVKKSDKYINPAITFSTSFSCFFKKWIEKLKNDKISEATPKKDLKYLFNKNEDIFLSLNYTPTLEMLYNINKNNIKYIHVVKDGVGYEFGHKKVENIHSIGHSAFGFNNYLKHQLIKDTSRIYKDNQNWFEDLSDKKIENIYFYGFSFADIDLIYIKGIFNNINKNELENIYLYNYKTQKEQEYEEQKSILNSLIYEAELNKKVKRFLILED